MATEQVLQPSTYPVSIITNGYFTPRMYDNPRLGFQYVYGQKVNFRLSADFTRLATKPLSSEDLERIEAFEKRIANNKDERERHYNEYLSDILNRNKEARFKEAGQNLKLMQGQFKNFLNDLGQRPATHDLCVFRTSQEQSIGLNIPVEYGAALPFMSAAGYIIAFEFAPPMEDNDVMLSPPVIKLKRPQNIIKKPIASDPVLKM